MTQETAAQKLAADPAGLEAIDVKLSNDHLLASFTEGSVAESQIR